MTEPLSTAHYFCAYIYAEYIYVCIYMCVCLYVCMCTYMYICVYTYICVHIYTYVCAEYIYMLNHYVVHLKLTHYKSTTLQFFLKKGNWNN